MAGTRVHYDSTTCPYAQRSWIALLEKGLEFELRKVDLANKDADFIKTYGSVNPDPAAAAKVPILVEPDGFTLVESGIIVEYLEQQYPEPALVPANAAAAAKARLFADTFSNQFTPGLFALLRATDAAAVEAGKEKLVAALKVLDAFLTRHGATDGGDYLLGGTYSVAEVSATGFVQRAVTALPAFRSIDLWQLVRDNKLDRLERWFKASLDRPSAQKTKPEDAVIIESLRKFVAPLEN